MEEKRLVDISVKELLSFLVPKIEEIINNAIRENSKKEILTENISLTVNQLVKRHVVGGRDKIMTLIQKGHIIQLDDKRISYPSVLEYLNSKKNEK